ncbi:class A beta-lactamase [Angustibacter sp. Root456]|uniref:class A beta-lactamase n=1 Tax=Angustibacter sp. Root456 TaxID=1736539 RepID=UPI0006FADF75|nr:class A beta-lactamase [Angustibacter sp. Root456]KQX64591.1 hypothetical protein ASD06_10205 [Angustibacter sp. Root456]
MTSATARLTAAGAALLLPLLAGCSPESSAPTGSSSQPTAEASASPSSSRAGVEGQAAAQLEAQFTALERRRGGRLGVYALDTGSDRSLSHRGDERFAMASTVKVLAVAALLDRLSAADLGRRLRWTSGDLVAHSPVTERFVDRGMTIRQLIDASLTRSDNTAANLLFEQVGGPTTVGDFVAAAGDDITSVDRREPALNDWAPGETRDTSTPRALGGTLATLVRGDVLEPADRLVLERAMRDSVTGAGLVRAGVPDGFVVEDKSGTARYGVRNDVAIVRPPGGRAPWILAVMTSHETADAEPDDELVAAATRIVVQALRSPG